MQRQEDFFKRLQERVNKIRSDEELWQKELQHRREWGIEASPEITAKFEHVKREVEGEAEELWERLRLPTQ